MFFCWECLQSREVSQVPMGGSCECGSDRSVLLNPFELADVVAAWGE